MERLPGNRTRQVKERLIPNATTGQFENETTLYLGSYEREFHQSRASTSAPIIDRTVHRHSFGSVVYIRSESPTLGTTVKLTTVLKDHLGSTDVLVTGTWSGAAFGAPSIERQAFDAWGERRKENHTFHRNSDGDPFATSGQDYDRGYTGHEQLDDTGLIHMNGRIFDPELGRFLSPDPYVQIPENSQNFNRYSYVLNNPLNATDPSGHLFMAFHSYKKLKWAKNNWDKIGPYVGIVVAVVLWWTGVGAMVGGAIASAASAATGGAIAVSAGVAWAATMGSVMGGVNAAMAGGDFGDILRGAIVGGAQAAISAGILHPVGEAAGATAGGFDDVMHVVGHGVVGGAANEAMGGKFSDGFLSAVTGASIGYLMGMTGISIKGNGFGAVAGRTAISGIAGGTVSSIGGGKFANGFYTAAFQHLLNADLEEFAALASLSSPVVGRAIAVEVTTSLVDRPLPVGEAVGAVVIAGAITYDATQRVHVTYTMTDARGRVYSERTSGYGDPRGIVWLRTRFHHMRLKGFGSPRVDVAAQGVQAYPAIRGREQQLIDFHGGVGSPGVGNAIRGVSKFNPWEEYITPRRTCILVTLLLTPEKYEKYDDLETGGFKSPHHGSGPVFTESGCRASGNEGSDRKGSGGKHFKSENCVTQRLDRVG